jgi:uncharacterized protein with HEPN domain
MHADAGKLLWDALRAVERVGRFSAGKSFDEYAGDELLRSAVERPFEIVGEALNRLRQVDAETAALIAELPRIVGFRNVLVHAYASVDDKLVWGIIEADMQSLRRQLEALVAQA